MANPRRIIWKVKNSSTADGGVGTSKRTRPRTLVETAPLEPRVPRPPASSALTRDTPEDEPSQLKRVADGGLTHTDFALYARTESSREKAFFMRSRSPAA